MTLCITFDVDGNEIERQTKPKRWVPRNGFERGDDGHFYKQLGNPLIISAVEKVEKVNSLEAIKKRVAIALDNNEHEEQEMDRRLSEVIHLGDRISFKKLKRAISWTCCTKSSNRTTFDRVCFSHNLLQLPNFDKDRVYNSLEINTHANMIRIWDKRISDQDPDFYVIKPLPDIECSQTHPIITELDD